ncbi:HAD-IC family P-type ATPase [Algoriphagus sp. AGSA1]|uniref:cation-translocating P-type ATPase n=1 Tax=Algoriphagus sp. AGSA1 TaxID=2907213 RepID=UPI001F1D40A3|nr:cation-transporting P-type ATPase [Algoriphagus sp. AGSA1]MCE7056414.1 HAD-IC family P-type ATPase [Algoriphagus sp. AGSA1]
MDIDQKHPYHTIGSNEVFKKVSSDENGLTSDEASKRQRQFGKNKLPEKGGTNPVLLFLKQFKDLLILILFVAAAIAFWADKMTDVYIILAVILFNAIMGFVQEFKAEKAIQAIKSMQQKKALVLRNGEEEEILAEDVVPGDIMILKEGNRVPADGRLIEANELRASEASLTGESMPVDKITDTTDEDASLGDRVNMVWNSTNIVNGMGKAVVTAIGKQTEIGKIAKSMDEMEMQDSNFRKKTNLLGKQMAVFALFVSLVIFSLGYWVRDYEFQEILLVTIAVLVSTIPEGLPAVISIVLAIGANRMAKKNALIREFTATEMMGSVSTLLTDKTGTLTQSILVIKKIFTGSGSEVAVSGHGYELSGEFNANGNAFDWEENPVERKLLAIAAFCNDAQVKNGQEETRDSEEESKTSEDTSPRETQESEEGGGSKGHESSKEEKASGHANVQNNKRSGEEKESGGEVKKEGSSEGNQEERQQTKISNVPDENPEGEENMDVKVNVKEDQVDINIRLKKTKSQATEETEDEEDVEEEEEEEEDAEENDEPDVVGDPTEVAMLVMGKKAGVMEKDPFVGYKLLDDLPFKSEQKFRASLVDTEEGPELFAIGAPERILELSTEYLTEEGSEELGEKMKQEIQDKMDEWADDAMRVLALGFRKTEDKESISAEDVKELCWVGMVGIVDPPREGVKESIEECKTAGIRVMMVTGDHKKTARAIAKEVGILSGEEKEDDYPSAMTTQELDVEDKEFDDYIHNVNVFARMNPDTKLRIAERLQAKDTLIAMTGDGVNDAPALKRADVGIAMGIRGTDVAKDASEIVLQDDNFNSIVNAIREGRIVFNNVKITSYFLLTTNFAFAIAFMLGISIGWPLLFTAAQILYVNLITDGIMDVALATEPGHGDIMKQKPVKKSEKILSWDILPYLLLVSAVMVTLTMLTFSYYLPEGEEMAHTGAFIVVSSTQLFNAYNMRSLRLSIFKIGPLSNRWVNLAFIVAIVLQFLMVKIPFFRDLLEFEDFPILDFLVIILISSVIIGAGELYKYLKFQKKMF